MMRKFRNYNQIVRHYRRKLVKNARQAFPYDFAFSLENLSIHLHFMLDYYKLGDNVVCLEYEEHPTRVELLEKLIEKLDAYLQKGNDHDFVAFCREFQERLTDLWD